MPSFSSHGSALIPAAGAALDMRLSTLTAQLVALDVNVLGLHKPEDDEALWREGGSLLSRTVALPIMVLDHPSRESQSRILSIAKQLSRLNLTASIVPAETHPEKDLDVYLNLMNAMERCASLPRSVAFCLVFEDDAVFHPQLATELSTTVDSLPSGWEALHMCPGFAWGRGMPWANSSTFHTNRSSFHLHAKYPGCEETPPSRYFRSWPSFIQCKPWLGAPVAMFLHREHASTMRAVLANASSDPLVIGSNGFPLNDVALSVHHLSSHFIAQEPQLCHELGEGTSFSDGPPEPGTQT